MVTTPNADYVAGRKANFKDWPSYRDKFYKEPVTPRRVKLAYTAWQKAGREHGFHGPEAYNAYQRLTWLRDNLPAHIDSSGAEP